MTVAARRLLLFGVLAGATAGAGLLLASWRSSRCPSYAPGEKPLRGEVRHRDITLHRGLGSPLYFDGDCWTTTPQPPTDLSF